MYWFISFFCSFFFVQYKYVLHSLFPFFYLFILKCFFFFIFAFLFSSLLLFSVTCWHFWCMWVCRTSNSNIRIIRILWCNDSCSTTMFHISCASPECVFRTLSIFNIFVATKHQHISAALCLGKRKWTIHMPQHFGCSI